MRRNCLLLSFCLLLLSINGFAADVTMRFAGRDLPPGDKFTVKATAEYVIFDPARKTTTREDEGKVFDDSMVELRESALPGAGWELTVPQKGEYSGASQSTRFKRPLAVVPQKMTALFVHIIFTRTTTGPDGKPLSLTREQTFPVTLRQGDAEIKDLCVIFEGGPEGSLTIGVNRDCGASVKTLTSVTFTINGTPSCNYECAETHCLDA